MSLRYISKYESDDDVDGDDGNDDDNDSNDDVSVCVLYFRQKY